MNEKKNNTRQKSITVHANANADPNCNTCG
jgi:hypothetical protein